MGALLGALGSIGSGIGSAASSVGSGIGSLFSGGAGAADAAGASSMAAPVGEGAMSAAPTAADSSFGAGAPASMGSSGEPGGIVEQPWRTPTGIITGGTPTQPSPSLQDYAKIAIAKSPLPQKPARPAFVSPSLPNMARPTIPQQIPLPTSTVAGGNPSLDSLQSLMRQRGFQNNPINR